MSSSGSQEGDSHDVVAVFDNQDVICLSSDLEVVRWLVNLNALASDQQSEVQIEHASLSTAKAVTHGLLHSREDIAAILNPSLDDKSELLELTQVLCIISRRSNGNRALGLFQMQPRSPDLPTGHLLPLKQLIAWDLSFLPAALVSASGRPVYSLHVNSGTLHLLVDGRLLTLDFSGTVPRISSEIDLSTFGIDSYLRISPDTLLTASQRSCQVLDVKYSSIQAELSIKADSTVAQSKKRKPEPKLVEDSLHAPLLVAYYADIGLAVGTWNNEVVGFQLGGALTRKRAKTEGPRLIDSLGKGIKSNLHSRGSSEKNAGWQKWQDRMNRLDKYASKGKLARFEELFASDLGIELEDYTDPILEKSQLSKEEQDTAMVSGTCESRSRLDGKEGLSHADNKSQDLLRKWKIPKSYPDTEPLQQKRYASYALSRIFRWIESPSSEGPRGYLKIDFFPPNVYQWLLHLGYLTKESIRRAILDDNDKQAMTTSLKDGDIVRAIVDFDPELHILAAMLNHGHFLPVGEVVQAVRLLMQNLDDQPKPDTATKLLTNGIDPSIDAMDVDITSELEAASHEIDRALAILDNGIAVRSNTLRPALIRLHTFPPTAISSTLRSMLPRHDLESLMRLLHHEFKNGGWTSPYDFADSEFSPIEPPSEDADDSSVAIIASLLSCTLDAIGPAMWLTTARDNSTEEFILDLLEDTSIALNGFWEATYIRGLVGELLRYASKVPKSQKPSSKTLQNQGKPFALDLKQDELPMLPMGAKPDMGIAKTKAGKAGKRKERSAREMGMLISKRVPKYSFERIVI